MQATRTEVPLPSWMDRYKASRMAQLRALGYPQGRIAEELGVSQQTVSRYFREIRLAADRSGDADRFLWGLLLAGAGVAAVVGLARLLRDG